MTRYLHTVRPTDLYSQEQKNKRRPRLRSSWCHLALKRRKLRPCAYQSHLSDEIGTSDHIWCGNRAIKDYSKFAFSNFLQTVITKRRLCKVVKWEDYDAITHDSKGMRDNVIALLPQWHVEFLTILTFIFPMIISWPVMSPSKFISLSLSNTVIKNKWGYV